MILGGWQNVYYNQSVHWIPMGDYKMHHLHKDGSCWCHPEEDSKVADFWIHHSSDGRESYEAGRKLQ